MPDLPLVVAGLNSTMRQESHLQAADHYGYVGEWPFRRPAESLDAYRERRWLCIGVLHHNLEQGAVADEENLRDREDFKKYLSGSLSIVLHGHTHQGKLGWLSQGVPIAATGSAALKAGMLLLGDARGRSGEARQSRWRGEGAATAPKRLARVVAASPTCAHHSPRDFPALPVHLRRPRCVTTPAWPARPSSKRRPTCSVVKEHSRDRIYFPPSQSTIRCISATLSGASVSRVDLSLTCRQYHLTQFCSVTRLRK